MLVREMTENDIPLMVDYWFNPDNQKYHERRGTPYGLAQIEFLQGQAEVYRKQMATPVLDRHYTTIILEQDFRQVAQVHLNDIRDDEKRRIHFHPWFKALPNKSFGQAISFWREAGSLSIEYFFSTYGMTEIIGDVCVNNKVANFCLEKMGFKSTEIAVATYIGHTGLYNRYKFYPA